MVIVPQSGEFNNLIEKMKLPKILVFGFIISLILSCDKYDPRELIVFNKSKNTIYSIISRNDKLAGGAFYDEFENDENYVYTKHDSLFSFVFAPIKSNTKVANHDTPRFWDSYFNQIADKKLRLFIVPQDSVSKYGWFKIFKKNIYAKKYELTLEDLEKQHWEVVYE